MELRRTLAAAMLGIVATYHYRRVNWLGFFLSFAAAGLIGAAGVLLFNGGATVTLLVVAVVAVVAPFASAVLTIRVRQGAIEVGQGLWGAPERFPVGGVLSVYAVEIPWRRRYVRGLSPGGVEVISAGGDRGVELVLAEERKARFGRQRVDRIILGCAEPESLLAAIETARHDEGMGTGQ